MRGSRRLLRPCAESLSGLGAGTRLGSVVRELLISRYSARTVVFDDSERTLALTHTGPNGKRWPLGEP